MSQTKYISATETAKLVRAALKKAFPGVKFSVRTDKYAGGASLDVGWVDGPSVPEVEAVAKRYEGASFDGMQDLQIDHYHEMDGQRVHFLADYIFCQRKYTRAFLERVVEHCYAKDGFLEGVAKPQISDHSDGTADFSGAGDSWLADQRTYASAYFRSQAAKTSADFYLDAVEVEAQAPKLIQ